MIESQGGSVVVEGDKMQANPHKEKLAAGGVRLDEMGRVASFDKVEVALDVGALIIYTFIYIYSVFSS